MRRAKSARAEVTIDCMKETDWLGLSKLARSVKRIRARPTQVYDFAVGDSGTSTALIRLGTRPSSKICSFAARTIRPYTQVRAMTPASTHSNRDTCMMHVGSSPKARGEWIDRGQEDFVERDVRHSGRGHNSGAAFLAVEVAMYNSVGCGSWSDRETCFGQRTCFAGGHRGYSTRLRSVLQRVP